MCPGIVTNRHGVLKENRYMDRTDFLAKDYEIKANYLSGHHQRLLTRFNFFLTLESALFGAEFIVGEDRPGPELPAVAVVGAIIAIMWLFVGVEDGRTLQVHKWHVKKAADRITLEFPIEGFHPVGEVGKTVIEELRKESDAEKPSEALKPVLDLIPLKSHLMPLISLLWAEPLKLFLLVVVPILALIFWVILPMIWL
jgi:hypothetical protein